MGEYISFAFLALLLGFKHSYDADHIIAVSNILRKVGHVKSAVNISMSWAAGHLLTAALITAILYSFKGTIAGNFLGKFEIAVALMLIFLGIYSLKDAFFLHSHRHRHGGIVHSHPHIHPANNNLPHDVHEHKHMLGIGIMHGLASNDELLILMTASLGVTSIGAAILGFGAFGIGVVIGMAMFSSVFSYILSRFKNDIVFRLVSFAAGGISVTYGIFMLYA